MPIERSPDRQIEPRPRWSAALTSNVETARTSAGCGKNTQIDTICGMPNNCQLVTVSSQPAAKAFPAENPFNLPHRTTAAKSSVAPMANDSGPSLMLPSTALNAYEGNQIGLSGCEILLSPITGSLHSPNSHPQKRCCSP